MAKQLQAAGYTWVEIYERADGRIGFRQRAANQKIISTGQGYTRKASAIRGAKRAHPGRPVMLRQGRGWLPISG